MSALLEPLDPWAAAHPAVLDVDEVEGMALRAAGGASFPLPVARWSAEPDDADHRILAEALAPVLDVGCGPARHTLALAERGVEALGIDVSERAVRLARRRGAAVLRADVFGEVPGAGRWRSALLLDGNLGIGGDPARLLRRVRELLRPGGRALVELEPPGTGTERFAARVDAAEGTWFPWARVDALDVARIAAVAGFRAAPPWTAEGRWFARLTR